MAAPAAQSGKSGDKSQTKESSRAAECRIGAWHEARTHIDILCKDVGKRLPSQSFSIHRDASRFGGMPAPASDRVS
jgi:hypothetical protein